MTTPHGHPDPAAPNPQDAPGHAAPVQARTESGGTAAWALGFLAYVPIPVANVLVAGIAQLAVGLRHRRHGGLAAENGVRAANWGLTQLCWPALLALSVLLSVLTAEPSSTGDGMQFTPLMAGVMVAMLVLYVVLGLMQLIYAIVGTVQANRGRHVSLPVIPFLRRSQG